ncbi:hypothetical protein UlMin_025314 [Ulmus minor]
MAEGNNKGELNSTSKTGDGTLAGKSTPWNCSCFRRRKPNRTQQREARGNGSGVQWFQRNRLLWWLLLITVWACLGSYVRSSWDHGHEKYSFGNVSRNKNLETEKNQREDLIVTDISFTGISLAVKNVTDQNQVGDDKTTDVVKAIKDNGVSKDRTERVGHGLRGKVFGWQKTLRGVEGLEIEEQKVGVPKRNASHGMLVGPFDLIEQRILEWSPRERPGTCDRTSDFARLVWSRRFVLIFHELSVTGASLSMMELATELLSCGATVYAVALSKKGELKPELSRRRISVLQDNGDLSFKTALKADLVIAGSAACASWIDQYIDIFPARANQVAWWIMENQREYFDQAKIVLSRVKMLAFLSKSQFQTWLNWCEEENIKLWSQPPVIPLSINDELACAAGIACKSSNPSSSTKKMMDKRHSLRESVRTEMGLTDNDVLLLSLSTINREKGQLLLLQSANLMIEKEYLQAKSYKDPVDMNLDLSTLVRRHHLRALDKMLNGSLSFSLTHRRKLLDCGGRNYQFVKILIGSVGAKRNKVHYVKELLRFVSQHPNLSKSVLWTQSTKRVAALYAAADAYIINSQAIQKLLVSYHVFQRSVRFFFLTTILSCSIMCTLLSFTLSYHILSSYTYRFHYILYKILFFILLYY